jgi:antitoxin HicB
MVVNPSVAIAYAPHSQVPRIIATNLVVAKRLSAPMKEQEITKMEVAARMKTSRAQIDRPLDPKNGGATPETLMRAAKVVGRRLRLESV